MGNSLLAVFDGEISGEFGFELAVIGVDGRAQGGLGGAAFAEASQNALHIAYSVGVIDIGNRSQRVRIGDIGFPARDSSETAFQQVQWNVVLRLEQLSQLSPISRQRSWLKK